MLGHGGTQNELARLAEAPAGEKVTGAVACEYHTAVWTDEGGLFTFQWGLETITETMGDWAMAMHWGA